MRYLLGLLVVAALAAGGAYIYAGQMPGPAIEIVKPAKFIGQTTTVEVTLKAPDAVYVGDFQIAFEQNGKQTPLVSFAQPGTAEIEGGGARTWCASPGRSAAMRSPT